MPATKKQFNDFTVMRTLPMTVERLLLGQFNAAIDRYNKQIEGDSTADQLRAFLGNPEQDIETMRGGYQDITRAIASLCGLPHEVYCTLSPDSRLYFPPTFSNRAKQTYMGANYVEKPAEELPTAMCKQCHDICTAGIMVRGLGVLMSHDCFRAILSRNLETRKAAGQLFNDVDYIVRNQRIRRTIEHSLRMAGFGILTAHEMIMQAEVLRFFEQVWLPEEVWRYYPDECQQGAADVRAKVKQIQANLAYAMQQVVNQTGKYNDVLPPAVILLEDLLQHGDLTQEMWSEMLKNLPSDLEQFRPMLPENLEAFLRQTRETVGQEMDAAILVEIKEGSYLSKTATKFYEQYCSDPRFQQPAMRETMQDYIKEHAVADPGLLASYSTEEIFFGANQARLETANMLKEALAPDAIKKLVNNSKNHAMVGEHTRRLIDPLQSHEQVQDVLSRFLEEIIREHYNEHFLRFFRTAQAKDERQRHLFEIFDIKFDRDGRITTITVKSSLTFKQLVDLVKGLHTEKDGGSSVLGGMIECITNIAQAKYIECMETRIAILEIKLQESLTLFRAISEEVEKLKFQVMHLKRLNREVGGELTRQQEAENKLTADIDTFLEKLAEAQQKMQIHIEGAEKGLEAKQSHLAELEEKLGEVGRSINIMDELEQQAQAAHKLMQDTLAYLVERLAACNEKAEEIKRRISDINDSNEAILRFINTFKDVISSNEAELRGLGDSDADQKRRVDLLEHITATREELERFSRLIDTGDLAKKLAGLEAEKLEIDDLIRRTEEFLGQQTNLAVYQEEAAKLRTSHEEVQRLNKAAQDSTQQVRDLLQAGKAELDRLGKDTKESIEAVHADIAVLKETTSRLGELNQEALQLAGEIERTTHNLQEFSAAGVSVCQEALKLSFTSHEIAKLRALQDVINYLNDVKGPDAKAKKEEIQRLIGRLFESKPQGRAEIWQNIENALDLRIHWYSKILRYILRRTTSRRHYEAGLKREKKQPTAVTGDTTKDALGLLDNLDPETYHRKKKEIQDKKMKLQEVVTKEQQRVAVLRDGTEKFMRLITNTHGQIAVVLPVVMGDGDILAADQRAQAAIADSGMFHEIVLGVREVGTGLVQALDDILSGPCGLMKLAYHQSSFYTSPVQQEEDRRQEAAREQLGNLDEQIDLNKRYADILQLIRDTFSEINKRLRQLHQQIDASEQKFAKFAETISATDEFDFPAQQKQFIKQYDNLVLERQKLAAEYVKFQQELAKLAAEYGNQLHHMGSSILDDLLCKMSSNPKCTELKRFGDSMKALGNSLQERARYLASDAVPQFSDIDALVGRIKIDFTEFVCKYRDHFRVDHGPTGAEEILVVLDSTEMDSQAKLDKVRSILADKTQVQVHESTRDPQHPAKANCSQTFYREVLENLQPENTQRLIREGLQIPDFSKYQSVGMRTGLSADEALPRESGHL